MKAVRAEVEAGGVATMAVPPLVLASRSPRRAHLLEMLGLEFDVLPAEVDESEHPAGSPAQVAEHLAREKALAVAARRPDALVIGCDTLVVVDADILGKPKDEEDAVRTLLRLQGREHRVETGIAVAAPGARVESAVEGTRVRFRSFDRQVAEEYVATGEPMDKAGGYGIQGYGATLVERIEGDYFAVMGLPIVRMLALFQALGWRYDFKGLEPVS